MSDILLVFTKIILTILFFPIAWGAAVAFHGYLIGIRGSHDEFFFWGMFGFLMVHFFFYQFDKMYDLGQKIVTGALRFMQPANVFIAKILPFYLTIIFVAFYVTTTFFDLKGYDHYFMFFAGFTFTMHLIMTARDLQEEENSFLKPSYVFLMMIVFTLVICVVVLLYNLAVWEFTFPEFLMDVKDAAWDFYYEAGQKVLFHR